MVQSELVERNFCGTQTNTISVKMIAVALWRSEISDMTPDNDRCSQLMCVHTTVWTHILRGEMPHLIEAPPDAANLAGKVIKRDWRIIRINKLDFVGGFKVLVSRPLSAKEISRNEWQTVSEILKLTVNTRIPTLSPCNATGSRLEKGSLASAIPWPYSHSVIATPTPTPSCG